MPADVTTAYEDFYRQRDPDHVYPVEFVVRAYLGSYPRLPRHGSFAGARVLDLGCGDGRNMPLLSNLGMAVYGVEISKDICERTADRMRHLGVTVDVRVGRNRAIPFEDRFFDHVLACHSCYYIDPGSRFEDNVAEIARVMKPGGLAWIRANPGRIRSLHLKDWSPDPAKGYKVLFGEGAGDWKNIFAAAESTGGAEYYLIEQEGSRYSELDTARRCLERFRAVRPA